MGSAAMLSFVPVTTFIAIESVDVVATLVASWLLLRMVVARPALRWSRPRVAVVAASAPTDAPGLEISAAELVENGITWPQPAWQRLAA